MMGTCQCGDPATATYNRKPVCKECWAELTLGIILNQNITICGGGKNMGVDKDIDAFKKAERD